MNKPPELFVIEKRIYFMKQEIIPCSVSENILKDISGYFLEVKRIKTKNDEDITFNNINRNVHTDFRIM